MIYLKTEQKIVNEQGNNKKRSYQLLNLQSIPFNQNFFLLQEIQLLFSCMSDYRIKNESQSNINQSYGGHQFQPHSQNQITQSQIYLKYIPRAGIKQNTIFRHHSRLLQDRQMKSAIVSQQHFIKLKKIMLGIKVKILRDQFIKKLRRKHCYKEFQQKKTMEVQHLCGIKGIQFSEKIQHISIVLNLVATMVLLVLASFSATLPQFTLNNSNQPIIYFLKIICLFVLLLRIFVNVFGHTFKNGQYLIFVSQITYQYLKTIDGYIDISTFVLLIFFTIFPRNQSLSAVIFCILTLLYMRAISQTINLQAAYIHTRRMNLLWRLTKILAFNFVLAHIVSTILLGISHFDRQHSWIVKYGIDSAPWYQLYAISFYWGAIIVTTVGFGDIACGNFRQALVVSILVIFTSMILGFNITQFTNIFSQYRESSHMISHNIVIFKRMIIKDENNNASIDPVLKKQIYKYINDKNFDKGDLQFSQRNQFINSLPEYLKKAYLRTANKRMFISVLFMNQLKHEILSLLTQTFLNYYLFPQQQIIDPTNTINILQQGKIGLTYKRKGSTINGMIFDFIRVEKKQNLLLLNSDFINLHKQSNHGYFGKSCCLIWSISVDNFINVLKTDLMDFQYYFSTLHKHPIDDDQWQTIKCCRCSSPTTVIKHNAFRCPQISYIPIRNMIIHRYLYDHNNKPQQRVPYLRTKQKMFRTSVLKYYKNYFQILVRQKSKIQTQQNYLLNFFPRRNFANFPNFSVLASKDQNQSYDDKNMVLDTDCIENFSYYYPLHNAGNLKLQPMDIERRKDFVRRVTMTRFHPISMIKEQK